jgi:hypothetical protein
MKSLMTLRSKNTLAGLALALASAIPGSAAVLHVPADYSTIQAAVDAAASGDTIQIAPGVYTNQVVIVNKNLTLSGSPGAILRATPDMQETLLSAANANGDPLLGIFKSDVVVSGLTFEGERMGDSYPDGLTAIWFLAASGSVEDCRITGFRRSTLTTEPDQFGFGIITINPHGYGVGRVNIQVLRSTFADNSESIQLYGDKPWGNDSWQPELLSTTFAVDDNTIVGNGPDTNGDQWGIGIDPGASGEVERNTITGCAYVGPAGPTTSLSYGIEASDGSDAGQLNPLAALQPIHFEGNILTNNQIDLLLLRGDGSTIVNNSFGGTPSGFTPTFFGPGLDFSGENVLVGTNRFSDMQTGIVAFGDDPAFGTYLGVTSNAVLTANGFCNVATNYVFEPQATYTVQDTLTCPDPTLNVTRAVLLTWPYNIKGYSVETATNMNGPWTNSNAAVFQQDGQNTVAVPANSDQQFFRLTQP